MGKLLIIVGITLVFIGVYLELGFKIPLGRLPGDFHIKRENFSFYFPLGTSILISLLLTLLIFIIQKLK